MTRTDYTDKIWRAINYRQTETRQDPDYLLIDNALRRIPPQKLQDFYEYLLGNDAFLDHNGNPRRDRLLKAVDAYILEEMDKIWSEHNLDDRTNTLIEKIDGVIEALNAKTSKLSQYDERAKEVSRHPEKLRYVDKNGESRPLFDDMEIDAIEHIGGLYDVIRSFSSPDFGRSFLREWIRSALKGAIARTTLFGEEGARAARTVSLPRPSAASKGNTLAQGADTGNDDGEIQLPDLGLDLEKGFRRF